MSARRRRRAPRRPGRGSLPHRVRAAEERLALEVALWGLRRCGPGLLASAWWDFVQDEEEAVCFPPVQHPDFAGLFIPWSLFAWVPELHGQAPPAEWPCLPLGLAFLEAHGPRLPAFERQLLAAACATPYSFHQVLDVERRRGLRLRDLLTGAERRVPDRQAAATLPRGAILFASVVPACESAFILGSGLRVLPPCHEALLADLGRSLAGPDGRVAPAELRACDPDLRLVYFDLVEERWELPPP